MKKLIGACIVIIMVLAGCTQQTDRVLDPTLQSSTTPTPSTTVAPTIEVSTIPASTSTSISTPTPTASPAPTSTPSPSKTPELAKLKTYVNERYGFSIDYPGDWIAGEESQNGDGKPLYIGNPDVDIRVYGAFHFPEFDNYVDKDVTFQQSKLNSGEEVTIALWNENGNYLFDMVYVSSENVEYHFYANVSADFYKANEKILLKTALGMQVPN